MQYSAIGTAPTPLIVVIVKSRLEDALRDQLVQPGRQHLQPLQVRGRIVYLDGVQVRTEQHLRFGQHPRLLARGRRAEGARRDLFRRIVEDLHEGRGPLDRRPRPLRQRERDHYGNRVLPHSFPPSVAARVYRALLRSRSSLPSRTIPRTMSDSRERFEAGALRDHTAATFAHFGMPAADAALAAEVLVDADLKGIESHGIAHLTWHGGYVPGLRDGRVNPTPEIRILRETPATLALDGDGGMGVVVATEAMDRCIARAEAAGIGMVTVRNGRHFGAAGYYAERAAARGLIGMASCNTPVLAVPAGGTERAFGTNPLAFAAPIAGREPFSLDMATTAVAGGKLEIAGRQGKRLPSGWAVDAEGVGQR